MSDWNGKVKCTYNNTNSFTKDKIYEIKNGYITNDHNEINEYSYNNVKELNNNFLSHFEEVKNIPKLCEILGVEPYERFKLLNDQEYEFYQNKEYYIDDYGTLFEQSGISRKDLVADIINHDQIIKIPQTYQYSQAEITTLSALWLNGYKYIARDKDDELCAYDDMPVQKSDYYDNGGYENYTVRLNKDFFQQVQFGVILNIEFELSKIN